MSGRFDTSGSMIPLLVSEISGCDAFCDVQCSAVQEELGILVVGLYVVALYHILLYVVCSRLPLFT